MWDCTISENPQWNPSHFQAEVCHLKILKDTNIYPIVCLVPYNQVAGGGENDLQGTQLMYHIASVSCLYLRGEKNPGWHAPVLSKQVHVLEKSHFVSLISISNEVFLLASFQSVKH